MHPWSRWWTRSRTIVLFLDQRVLQHKLAPWIPLAQARWELIPDDRSFVDKFLPQHEPIPCWKRPTPVWHWGTHWQPFIIHLFRPFSLTNAAHSCLERGWLFCNSKSPLIFAHELDIEWLEPRHVCAPSRAADWHAVLIWIWWMDLHWRAGKRWWLDQGFWEMLELAKTKKPHAI